MSDHGTHRRKSSDAPPASGSPIDAVRELPDISDLAQRLRFSAKEGRVWLDEMRMVLLHISELAALRRELISQIGIADASAILFRIGYASGAADAGLVRKVRPNQDWFDSFSVGPQLHTLEGWARVDPVHLSFDVERGHFDGDFIWTDSAEAEAHLAHHGIGNEPTCWIQTGYASGFTSAFMGRAVAFREVECRGMGDEHCRIIGRPEHLWADEDQKSKSMVSFAGLRAWQIDSVSGPNPEIAPTRSPSAPPPAEGPQNEPLVGISTAFTAAATRLDQVAPTTATVLLLGETGVGKERFARRLHEKSARPKGPFVAVNCSAIPKSLIESELFGVVRGAFTGATESRPGRFERAQGGTLFLDELATLSRPAQAKLLRAIQERQIERVGGTGPVDVDVRVVAATNEDLRELVKQGRFRTDLYYRVAVFPIRVPTLRERRADIPRLLDYFVRKFSTRHNKTFPGLSGRAVNALLDHDYPGNVRELENMVERAVILGVEGKPLDVGNFFEAEENLLPRYLAIDPSGGGLAPPSEPHAESAEVDELVGKTLESGMSLDHFEARLLDAAVARAKGNLTLAAKSLGLTRPQLAYRFKKKVDDR